MSENYQNNENRTYFNSASNVSVSTAMMTIWDSATGAQLKLSIMNNGLGLAIWLPFTNPDGSRKYPVENRYSSVITTKNMIALERLIIDHIIPSYEKGINDHKGIFLNSTRSTMIEIEVREGEFYILMHRNCDPVSRIPKDTIRFKFDNSMIVDGYDSVTGEMMTIPVQADFFVFSKAICAFNDLSGGYYAAHGSAMTTVPMNQKFMEYIRAIAESVHAQLPAPVYQHNGGYRAQNNYNVNNVAAAANLPNVAATEVNSLSDLVS